MCTRRPFCPSSLTTGARPEAAALGAQGGLDSREGEAPQTLTRAGIANGLEV